HPVAHLREHQRHRRIRHPRHRQVPTVPGPAGVTVTPAVPLCPSLVAVIVAAPTLTPFTRPLPPTVATEVLELAHVTSRPVRELPFASFSVAPSCTVRPTPTLAVAGLTTSEATGTGTVIPAVPLRPSLVAVIVDAPTLPPLTRPPPPTV